MFSVQTASETGCSVSPIIGNLDFFGNFKSELDSGSAEFLSLADYLMSNDELNPHFNALLFSAAMSLLPYGANLNLPDECYNIFARFFIEFKLVLQERFPFTSIILSEELSSERIAKHLEPDVYLQVTSI